MQLKKIPSAGLPKAGEALHSVSQQREIGKPALEVRDSEGRHQKADIPKPGIPKSGRFRAPLIQTPPWAPSE